MSDSDAVSDELKNKIYAYVEREAGHDEVPLSTGDEAMVRWLLRTNRAAQALAQELRDAIMGVEVMFSAGADMPVPDDLATMVRAHGALREEGRLQEAAGLVADFKRKKRKG